MPVAMFTNKQLNSFVDNKEDYITILSFIQH
jgi:hypothetical protein